MTCSRCHRDAHRRGLCRQHYRRFLTTGDPGGPIRTYRTTCEIDGCDRPHRTNGWCAAHYLRWLRTGEVGGPIIPPLHRERCEIDGCDRPHHGRGFCSLHYQRWAAHGDPIGTDPRTAAETVEEVEWLLSGGESAENVAARLGYSDEHGVASLRKLLARQGREDLARRLEAKWQVLT